MEHVECSTICCGTNGPEKIEQYIYIYMYVCIYIIHIDYTTLMVIHSTIFSGIQQI